MTAGASPPRLRRVDTAKLVLFAVRHTAGPSVVPPELGAVRSRSVAAVT